ncbi:molybdenum cofactor guanylyltransferase [Candidatus Poribacteria bacterium]|nr:molybdenum cofactor guanylyltransferase [Candidatus Poribacteria bacterium]
MGTDKALIRLGTQTLGGRALQTLNGASDEVLVVGALPAGWDVPESEARCIPDDAPGLGVLGGIATALRVMQHDLALVIACDMPFLTPEALWAVAQAADGFDGAMVCTDRGYEPCCAAYARSALPAIQRMVDSGLLAAQDVPRFARIRAVTADELRRVGIDDIVLTNLNTPADLERVRDLMAKRDHA